MRNNTRRQFLKTAAGALGAGLSYRFVMAEGAAYPSLPDASPEKLPRWRGFNLLNYFMEHNQYPFEERVFRGIADFGFNFVRLPLDYRCWIVDGDWNRIHSEKIDAVLRALRFGEQYSIHVMLNFHRAPGYTVAHPAEKKPLWTDPEAQDVCCRHWAEFARRCKGIPNSHLSFNLFNEPMSGKEEEVLPATIRVIEAIRAEDPDRLICCDGIRWGRQPIPGLVPYKVAQATRGYDPMDITHYKAEWVDSKSVGQPSWPLTGANGLLVSPTKSEVSQALHRPLTIEGPFEGGERLRIKVQTVSNVGLLVVEADG
ncbi:MAG: cellulase family glycosylhydrolase, partial [Thermoguttaceae bacterium]|nr:cellulase family glycosylhydrolase [Thermoguttaceae bacterium]